MRKFQMEGASTSTASVVPGCCILQAGLIAGGKNANEGRHTVFFTALDPMNSVPDEEYQGLSRPRKVQNKCKWKITQDAIHWIYLKKAQDKS